MYAQVHAYTQTTKKVKCGKPTKKDNTRATRIPKVHDETSIRAAAQGNIQNLDSEVHEQEEEGRVNNRRKITLGRNIQQPLNH